MWRIRLILAIPWMFRILYRAHVIWNIPYGASWAEIATSMPGGEIEVGKFFSYVLGD